MKLMILTCLLAAASAGLVAPLAYSTSFGNAVPLLTPYNYRGPLSLGPGQPASILGADGRPLDTFDVNLDRSAHVTAKTLNSGLHLLKRRSVFTPIVGSPINRVATPLMSAAESFAYRYAGARLAPLTYAPTVYTHFF